MTVVKATRLARAINSLFLSTKSSPRRKSDEFKVNDQTLQAEPKLFVKRSLVPAMWEKPTQACFGLFPSIFFEH